MAIYKGDKKIIALYKGDKKIIKRYKGTQVVYDVTNSGGGEDIETTSTLTFNWSKTGTSQPTFYTQNSASGNTFYTATTNPYTVDIAEDQDKIIFHNLNVDNISSFPNDRSWRGILIHNFTGNNLVLKDIDLTKATKLYYDLVITASTSSTVDLSGLKLSDTVDMSNYKVPNVNTLNLDGWKFNSLKSMFESRSALKNLSLKDVNTSNVTSCRETFSRSSGLTSLDLTSMDVSNVTDMYYMFYNCKGLNTIDISGWDMSKVTNCDYMFYNCTGLTEINAVGVIPPITTVTNPQSMFYAADSFTLILGKVSQEYYDWWLTALTKSNVNGTVTIEYTIV